MGTGYELNRASDNWTLHYLGFVIKNKLMTISYIFITKFTDLDNTPLNTRLFGDPKVCYSSYQSLVCYSDGDLNNRHI